jgi:DNA-binding response OmpR family regulator
VPERLLLLEPDGHLRDSILLHTSIEGFECEAADDGRAALERVARDRFDAMIVSCGDSAEGLWFCDALRLRASRAPILLLASRTHAAEALSALETCVDDYLPTPFGMRELVARVRALVRRSRLQDDVSAHLPGTIACGDLLIDPARRHVRLDDRILKLTEQEFQLLYALASEPGVVFTRDALLARIWGARTFVTTRSVDALVKRLRGKLRHTIGDPDCVVTVRGVGYRFAEYSTICCRDSPSPSMPSVTTSPRFK